MIFFEFEIERWHDKGYIFNCNMDGDNFLAIYSNHRDEMLSQFYFDVLIISYTQIDVLDCVDLGSYKQADLKNVLLFCANVSDLEFIVFQENGF